MKGLLLKDFYVMGREVKFFLLMILAFALIPQMYTRVFAILYSAMLPITAMAYDEQAKWNHLAAMMPYRKRDLVQSKYIIGIVLSSIAGVLSLASEVVIGAVKGEMATSSTLLFYLMLLGAAYLLLSINLPLVCKLGTEKGRMAYLLVTVGLAVIIAIGGSIIEDVNWLFSWILPAGVFAIGIIAIPISIQVATGIYQRKEL